MAKLLLTANIFFLLFAIFKLVIGKRLLLPTFESTKESCTKVSVMCTDCIKNLRPKKKDKDIMLKMDDS